MLCVKQVFSLFISLFNFIIVVPLIKSTVMSSDKIAIVTGANKGIGFAIVKGLLEKFDGKVYLTSRDVKRGEDAVKKLNEQGLKPLYHQLDITDDLSVNKFRDYIKTAHGGIDVLVNNAAIAFKTDATEPFSVQAKETIAINYFGTLRVCNALFPLLRQNAKVVNISSSCGHLSRIPSADIRNKFSHPKLTVPELNKLMEQFIQDAEEGKQKAAGWGNSTYVVSKVGLSALTVIHQREFDNEQPNRNISINSVHPGYVDTDMSSHKGPMTIEEGAKAPLFLALEANYKGKYLWHDKQVVDWFGDSTPAYV